MVSGYQPSRWVKLVSEMARVNGDLDFEPEEPDKSVGADSPFRWVNASGERPDVETAVLLRSTVLPLIEKAESWTELITVLEDKNFGLAIQGGRLVLTEQSNGKRICTGRFLGKPLAVLVSRLGKPHVRFHSKNGGFGEILRDPISWRRRGA